MIKFFRKIRQQLIQQNKVGRYLKYAIGEIILVVIGILIALQINNWNERRIDNNNKIKYYKQLLKDFESNKSNINFNIKRYQLNSEAYKNYQKKLKTPNLHLDTIYKHLRKIDFTISTATFKFQTFNSLESTGDLKLFKSNFRNALMSLNSLQKEYLELNTTNNKVYTDLIKVNPLSFKNLYINETKNQKNLYNNQDLQIQFSKQIVDFNHALRFKYFNEKQYEIYLNNILNQIIELEALILKELQE